MKFTLQFLGLLICLVVIAVLMGGCASGVRILGEVSLSDSIVRKYIQVGSEGHDSARLTVIESFDIHTDKAGTTHVKQANQPIVATTDGLVGKVVQGTGAAAMGAGGQVGAAYLRRPDIYNSSTVQSGGGADVATSTSTSTEQEQTAEGSQAGAFSLGVGKGGSSSSYSEGGEGGKSFSFSNAEGGQGGNATSRSRSNPSIRTYNNNDLKNFQLQGQQQGQGQGQYQRQHNRNDD